MWRTTRLLALSMMAHVADATVSDPVVCYILDAVLLLYCIIFTALYFRQKFARSPLVTQGENKETQEGDGGDYEAVGTQSNPEGAAGVAGAAGAAVRRQRGQATDDNYAALQHRTADTYSQIQTKNKKKKKKDDAQAEKSGVYESLSQPSADTYNSLEMRPLPPRNPPK